MSSVLIGSVLLQARVVVNTDKAPVISRCNQLLIVGHGASVDVRSITAWWEDALNIPSQLGGLILPNSNLSVRCSLGISLLGLGIEEEELVGTAHGSDVA